MENTLNKLLQTAAKSIASYLDRLLPSLFDNWWKDAVVDKLSFQQQRRVEQKGIVSLSSLDLAALLRVLDQNWYQISMKMNLSPEARTARLAEHSPTTLPRARPVEREPEEVEGRRTLAALVSRRRAPEGKKSRLVRMQGQSEAPQPQTEHIHHAPRIVLFLEPDDELVGITDQVCPAPQPRLHLSFEPEIEHGV